MKKFRSLIAAVLVGVLPVATQAAVVHGVTTKAKQNFIDGVYLAADTYKAALFGASATVGAATTTWASISASILTGSGTCTGYSNTDGWTLAGRASNTSGTSGIVGWTTPLTAGSSCTIANAAALVIYESGGDVMSVHCLDGTTGTCPAYLSCTAGTCTVNLSATATITIAMVDGVEKEVLSSMDVQITGVFGESHEELAALSAYDLPTVGGHLWNFAG